LLSFSGQVRARRSVDEGDGPGGPTHRRLRVKEQIG